MRLRPALATIGFASTVVLAAAAPAPGAHADCALDVTAPSNYAGAAIASGSADCASPKNTIRVTMTLTRDGTPVDVSERTCHKSSSCWTYVFADDISGDQRWCATISARVGNHALAGVSRCEGEPL